MNYWISPDKFGFDAVVTQSQAWISNSPLPGYYTITVRDSVNFANQHDPFAEPNPPHTYC